MNAFKIKHNFYYKNIKKLVKLLNKKNRTCIHMDTFKIKHNFYHKNINNQSNYFFEKVNIISHILKFLLKVNTTYDHFFSSNFQ